MHIHTEAKKKRISRTFLGLLERLRVLQGGSASTGGERANSLTGINQALGILVGVLLDGGFGARLLLFLRHFLLEGRRVLGQLFYDGELALALDFGRLLSWLKLTLETFDLGFIGELFVKLA